MKFIFLFVFSVFFSIAVFGQISGCLVGSSMYYQNLYVSGGVSFFQGNGIYSNYSAVCSPGNTTSTYYNITNNANVTCYADYTGNNNVNQFDKPNRYNNQGVLVTFNLVTCPIDDYIYVLFALISFITITQIKKKVAAT